jgi:SAM-dependent methyltransferase
VGRFLHERVAADPGGGYPPERTLAECDGIERMLALSKGARILDIPCGIGRHSIELSRRGYRMMGVDFKPDFIEAARASAASAGVVPEFEVGDMRSYSAAEPFDGSFCYFGSFGYANEDDDRRFVRGVADSLKPGAPFLLESHIQETLLAIYQPRAWNWGGSKEAPVGVMEERSWNVDTGRIDVVWRLVDRERVSTHSSSIRIYSYRELRDLFLSSGFSRIEAHEALTGAPFEIGMKRACILATRS